VRSPRPLIAALVLVLCGLLAPAASATITPTLALSPTSGTAGSTGNLETDIKFSPTGSDSVKNLALILPAGLLANASIDDGKCLTSKTPIAACQVGSGSVTAAEHALGSTQLTLSAEFDLVAPPGTGDLAGLAVLVKDPVSGKFGQLGSPAAVTVRPSSSASGVGLDIAFTGIPDTYPVLGIPTSISVDEIQSTFDGLRFPASCPKSAATLNVLAVSYSDSTLRGASAPLAVTGCSSLPYDPAFAVTATKDAGDPGVKLVTDITQTHGQATSRSVALAFPPSVLQPNTAAVVGGNILCANPSSGTCKTIGSASASSPLYPHALQGKDYLTGSLLSPSITIVFPAPFAITLSGQVSLAANSTTFTGVPDIPLTDLQVTLAGGPDAVFESLCSTTSGTATATLTSQNGDHTVRPSSNFNLSGCSTTTPGGSSGSGGGGSGVVLPKVPRAARPRIASASLSGLPSGKPTLRFKLTSARNAPRLSSFAIKLPQGLSFIGHRVHKRLTVRGLSLKGAQVKSASLNRGRLDVQLRRAVSSVTVALNSRALKETAGLRRAAKRHRIRSLKLTVSTENVARQVATLTFAIKNLHL
jgi:hypothetical protein